MTTIVYDVETTGLLKAESAPINLQPHITELFAAKIDDDCNVIATYNQMFKVPIPLDEKVTKITGITDEMLIDKNPFIAHWREVADFFSGCPVMVAHNLSFDRDCLYYELKRINKQLNFPWPQEHVCTIEKSFHYKNYRLNLGALHEYLFNEKFEGAHRAEADVMALVKCYKEMKARE